MCLNPQSHHVSPNPPNFILILTPNLQTFQDIGSQCRRRGPRQMFDVAIQAVVGGKVVAKVSVSRSTRGVADKVDM